MRGRSCRRARRSGRAGPGAVLATLAAAFSQAGSQSITASLGEVGDAETRTLMVALHCSLPAAGRARALQQAVLAVLRALGDGAP